MTKSIQPPDDHVYEESAAYHWTERAHELLNAGDLHARIFAADGVVSSHVWGRCPRCGHQLDTRQVHTAIVGGIGRGGRRRPRRWWYRTGPLRTMLVDVACGCQWTHRHAPSGSTGCGVSFRVELRLPEKS
jgi:hypothetical protein